MSRKWESMFWGKMEIFVAKRKKNVMIVNRDTSAVIARIGQGRVKPASLTFSRSGADQRVITVDLVFQSNSYGGSIDTPVSTVVTTLNSGT